MSDLREALYYKCTECGQHKPTILNYGEVHLCEDCVRKLIGKGFEDATRQFIWEAEYNDTYDYCFIHDK